MIPHLFHWVWIGATPLPTADKRWMRSWLDFNTDWHGIVWAEQPAVVAPALSHWTRCQVRALPPLVNQKFYDSIERWVTGLAVLAARSDIIRCDVVARHGGIYLDTDVECFQPIDPFLDGVRLCMADEHGPQQGNYLFGGVRNHPALWRGVRDLGPHLLEFDEGVYAPVATGPCFLGPRLRAHPELVVFPQAMCQPLGSHHDPFQVAHWPPCALSNHHIDGKWCGRSKATPPADYRQW